MHQALAFCWSGLESDDVYVAIGERPAKFPESARPVFHVDAELLGGWHDRLPPVVSMRNAVARSCGIDQGKGNRTPAVPAVQADDVHADLHGHGFDPDDNFRRALYGRVLSMPCGARSPSQCIAQPPTY